MKRNESIMSNYHCLLVSKNPQEWNCEEQSKKGHGFPALWWTAVLIYRLEISAKRHITEWICWKQILLKSNNKIEMRGMTFGKKCDISMPYVWIRALRNNILSKYCRCSSNGYVVWWASAIWLAFPHSQLTDSRQIVINNSCGRT